MQCGSITLHQEIKSDGVLLLGLSGFSPGLQFPPSAQTHFLVGWMVGDSDSSFFLLLPVSAHLDASE